MRYHAGSGFVFRFSALAVLLFLSCLAPSIAMAALPTISGTPPTQVAVGTRYWFRPNANDVDGDALIFWIQARPAWTSFDWRTGTLTGIPTSANAGVYSGIVIGVSDAPDRSRVRWLPAFSITVGSGGGSTTNERPIISGTPPTSVVSGQTYSFRPTASDPNGDTLSFWITGRPPWATLDRATGRLYGTPTAAQVGTYSNIVIGVTDGSKNHSLAPFSINVLPVAFGSATLTWLPPTTRTDGSPLTNLAGYRVRWGTTSGSYPNSVRLTNPGLTSYVVQNLAPATYYFVVAAFDSNGVESSNSNVAQKTIR
jgi:hypothetical protein